VELLGRVLGLLGMILEHAYMNHPSNRMNIAFNMKSAFSGPFSLGPRYNEKWFMDERLSIANMTAWRTK